METKKTPESNLETKRNLFFQVGLVVALAVTLVAFEWTTVSWTKKELPGEPIAAIDFEELPPIIIIKPVIPEPAKPEKPKNPDLPPEIKKVVDKTEPSPEIIPEKKPEVLITVPLPPEDLDEIVPFEKLESEPSFFGGDEELFKYLQKSLSYPTIARDNNISGTVYVEFVVNRDGSISDVTLKRGTNFHLDKEAQRVISSMPKWIPGKQREKPVRVKMVLPIHFKLKS